MGIPKFYRWLSERYPLLNQPTDVGETPVVDNLYLDMNGIIHNCTHGNTPGQKLTEAEMVAKIFTYLDKLFQVVKPQKLLFMAIDGSAPRAKMNQQRSRRFRSSRDAEESKAEAIRKGEVVPDDAFDSNCITPGTPFMARLGAHFRFFVRKKISEDPAWQRPTIIFSGHDVPGEGEHKIMEHIRHQKKRPEYVPNQRHCLYGLDADLIMLALVSHEPHFCLLREVVNFSGGARGRPSREVLDNPCQEHFMLFQIGLLREYLELEFRNPALPFDYDVERIIDDFVLFCMLIGNDFLPALPTLDIAEGALDKLFAIYKDLLPSMGGYLTHAGQLHRGRLEMILHRLADLELETLEQRAQDAEYMEQKKSDREARGNRGWKSQAHQQELDERDCFQAELDAMASGNRDLAAAAKLEGLEDEQVEEQGPTMMGRQARQLMMSGQGDAGLQAFKAKYYQEKLGISKHNPADWRQVVHSFIEGLHWVLEYYYRGVASWTWFFPYHYAPMISDMVGIEEFHVAFQQGKPFLPFQQLLGVLPSASHRLLPEPYQWLMTDANSPVADFYPTQFRVDMEGKRNDWEGVVLVPFIEEARLLAAHNTVGHNKLAPEEQARNTLGDMLVFSHQEASTEDSFCLTTLPSHFGDVARCNSRCVRQPPLPPLPAGQPGFLPQVMAGTRVGVGSPAGYPTLKTLVVTPALQHAGVEVFGQGSKKESLILQVVTRISLHALVQDKISAAVEAGMMSADQVASSILGQRCWVRWPYLQEALVIAVSDRNAKVDGAHGSLRHDDKAAADWASSAAQLSRQFLVKHGVDVGRSELVLHVQPLEGLMRRLDGTVEKRFAKKEMLYPLQATLRRNPAPDPRFDPSAMENALGPLHFAVGQKAIFLGRAYYGCVATILPDVSAGLSRKGTKLAASASSMLHIQVQAAPPAAATAQATARRVIGGVRVQYMPSGLAARKLQMSPRTLGKLTGNLWLNTGDERVDLGLCVKHGAKSMCVPDYVQAQPDNTGWTYSQALIGVIEQYKKRHSWVFAMVDREPDGNDYSLSQVFPGMRKEEAVQKVKQVKAWLQSLPLAKRPLVKTSVQTASEEAVRAVQQALPVGLTKAGSNIELENVNPTLLLPPTEKRGVASELAGGLFELGDRVACLRNSGTPPLGSRGTVVGVHEGAVEVLFDADFIGGGDLHGRCHGHCGGMLPPADLLNLAKPHFSNITGADAPRQVAKTPPPGFGASAAAAQHQTTPASMQLATESSANGISLGPDAQSAQVTPARQPSIGQGAQVRPRHKTPQPQCPPHKDAKGFTMGRGRATLPVAPAAPGSSSTPAQYSFSAQMPQANEVSTAASSSTSASVPERVTSDHSTAAHTASQGNMGQQFLQQLQQTQAVSSDHSQIGQAFLQQLQAGPSSGPTTDLGKGFLQQLQPGNVSQAAPVSAQQQPRPEALSNITVAHVNGMDNSNAGEALLSQLQQPSVQLGTVALPAQLQRNATGLLPGMQNGSSARDQYWSEADQQQQNAQNLAHLQALQLAQTQAAQAVQPAGAAMQVAPGYAAPSAQPGQVAQPNAGTALLQQLHGTGSAQSMSHGSRAVRQPQPGLQTPGSDMAQDSATSFQQMLRAALKKKMPSQKAASPGSQALGFAARPSLLPENPTNQLPSALLQQQLPPAPTQTDLPSPSAFPPGFAHTYLSPAQQQAPNAPPPGFDHTRSNAAHQQSISAGQQLLQQLQSQGAHNLMSNTAYPGSVAAAAQQPFLEQQQLPAALHQRQAPALLQAGQVNAGHMLLQQLQRGFGAVPGSAHATAAGQARAASADGQHGKVGVVPGAVQPMPSAPPAPAAVMLAAAGQNGDALVHGRGPGRGQGRAGRGRTGVQQGRGLRQLQPQHVGAVSMEQQDGEAQRQRQASGTSQRQLQPPQPQVKVLQHAAQASMAAGGSKAAHQEGRNSTNQAITGAAARPGDDLAALWAQLQLKHTQEAAAASMSRRASVDQQQPSSSALPHTSRDIDHQLQQSADVLGSQPGSNAVPVTGEQGDAIRRGTSSTATPQQGSSEEAFWKMLQQ